MAHRLLLADDSITIQKVVELVLAEEDFEIKSVSNGEDALKVIGDFKPDIVLADIEMPKVNGYQLCEKIKQNPATANVPVILLAGAFEPIDEDLSRQVGADDSVIKPFESQELISKVNAALTLMPGEEEVVAIAEEEEAGIEPFEIAEEAEALTAEETAEVASSDEDLWAMEDITTGADELTAETAIAEESAGIEAFEIEEEAEEVREPFVTPQPIKTPEPVRAEPFRAPVREFAAPQPAREFAVPQVAMPSADELAAMFRKAVDEKLSAVLTGMDLKDMVRASLAQSLKDSVEKVLWEVAPEMVDKVLREVISGALSSLSKEVEKVIWETVPDLAATIIGKEIEKIKTTF